MTPDRQNLCRAVRAMLPIVRAERQQLLESYCVLDKRGKPKLATLDDPLAITLIRDYDRVIRLAVGALAQVTP
ncbi:MAG TPA: hypothetical protein VK741_21740 [Acetobacteraceae bacterium]|jgi:hypothetical protein|nr:hypothetical protein [Acetobacteraceae bacterium]